MTELFKILNAVRGCRGGGAAQGDLIAMLKSIADDDHNSEPQQRARSVIEAVLAGQSFNVDQLGLNSDDVVFVRNLLILSKILNRSDTDSKPTRRVSLTTKEEDFIAEDFANEKWSLFKIVNFAILLTIAPRKTAALVCSVRNEGLGILEWIAHHRALGFDDIFIYTNSNTDGSTELLRCLADHQVIYLIENEVGDAVAPQRKSYEHSLHLLPKLRDYKWVSYLDADEFLISRCEPDLSLRSLLREIEARPYPVPDAVLFNWKWFGSENAFAKTDGYLWERFQYSVHNRHVKTLARTNSILSMRSLHVPVLFPGSSASNSLLQPLPGAAVEIDPHYGIGQVNHYWNKSFEEFALKKFRGRGAVGALGEQRSFESFFVWGNNGQRGNYDPPLERVLARVRLEYDDLLALDGVSAAFEEVKAKSQAELNCINKELDLRRVYLNRGKM